MCQQRANAKNRFPSKNPDPDSWKQHVSFSFASSRTYAPSSSTSNVKTMAKIVRPLRFLYDGDSCNRARATLTSSACIAAQDCQQDKNASKLTATTNIICIDIGVCWLYMHPEERQKGVREREPSSSLDRDGVQKVEPKQSAYKELALERDREYFVAQYRHLTISKP